MFTVEGLSNAQYLPIGQKPAGWAFSYYAIFQLPHSPLSKQGNTPK
jgi:hypothetical protein